MSTDCAIVGIGEVPYLVDDKRDRTEIALAAILAAVEDAGLDRRDVDGIVKYTRDSSASVLMLAANLGLRELRFASEVPFLGGSAPFTAATAVGAVSAGLADVVVCYRASSNFDYHEAFDKSYEYIWQHESGATDFHRPFGLVSMVAPFALALERHMYEFGTTEDEVGAISVTSRKHASLTPGAAFGDTPLTLTSRRSSSKVSGRLRTVDCQNFATGACAFIVTSVERAASLRHVPVTIASTAASTGQDPAPFWEFLPARKGSTTSLATAVASRVFAGAGITPAHIDVAEMYDCTAVNVLLQLEDYGFCAKGEGGPFAASGAIELGGEIPVNTHGGNLSYGTSHGMSHVAEGVRQLRGDAGAQVPDAEFALVTGGAIAPATSALILQRNS